MTLKEIREAFEEGSTVVNQFNLKLIFAGIAVVWLLKGGLDTSIVGIPKLLLAALLCFCFSLFLHLAQAYIHTIVWYQFYKQQKSHEQGILARELHDVALQEENILVNEKEEQSKLTWVLWGIKPIVTIIGYVLVGCYLIGQLSLNSENVSKDINKSVAVKETASQEIGIVDTMLQATIKTNQEAIIKLLQPQPEVKKVTTSKKTAKKNSSKAKKQPLYLPLDTITCDGKEYMIVEKVK